MSRTPHHPLPPNPFMRRQIPRLNEALRQLGEQSSITGSNGIDVGQYPGGVTIDRNVPDLRDQWFYAVIVDTGADGTNESDLDDSVYFFKSLVGVQDSGDDVTNQTPFYIDDGPGAIWGAGTNIAEVAAQTNNLQSIPATTSKTEPVPDMATIIKVYAISSFKKNGTASDSANVVYIIEPLTSNLAVIVKVVTAATGGGKYNGNIITPSAGDVDLTSGFTADDLGDLGPACIVLNLMEVGQTTHDLTDPDNGYEFYFLGRIIQTNSDGTPVVAINGFFFGC